MQFQSLQQWLTYLESIHPSAIDMGLERVAKVADALNIEFSNSTVITVAGTNGKGSTCRVIEQTLLHNNKTVAVYSSPHLIDYRERVRYQGSIQDEQEYCDALAKVEAARGDITLTYFEFGTLAGMVMMQQWQPDYVVLEVGLGGRLDATNIIAPDVAVITTIDLDHQDWLGDTRAAIGREKAGIIRSTSQVIVGELDPPHTIQAVIDELGAKALFTGTDFSFTQSQSSWDWRQGQQHLSSLPIPQLPVQNVATAFAVLQHLNELPDRDTLVSLLANYALPGRMQKVAANPDIYVDVAHNPQATRLLAQRLKQGNSAKVHFVVAMLADKAIADTLAPLSDIDANWFVAPTLGPRGLAADDLAAHVPIDHSVQVVSSVLIGLEQAQSQASECDVIVVFGSFLTVAEVLPQFVDSK